ncbi:MAG: hypothetical protein KJZ83_08335 [Burkholderiaceae bacterium]|nr:hypothetical protein [Burkholderiaceae bacterium]
MDIVMQINVGNPDRIPGIGVGPMLPALPFRRDSSWRWPENSPAGLQ